MYLKVEKCAVAWATLSHLKVSTGEADAIEKVCL